MGLGNGRGTYRGGMMVWQLSVRDCVKFIVRYFSCGMQTETDRNFNQAIASVGLLYCSQKYTAYTHTHIFTRLIKYEYLIWFKSYHLVYPVLKGNLPLYTAHHTYEAYSNAHNILFCMHVEALLWWAHNKILIGLPCTMNYCTALCVWRISRTIGNVWLQILSSPQ